MYELSRSSIFCAKLTQMIIFVIKVSSSDTGFMSVMGCDQGFISLLAQHLPLQFWNNLLMTSGWFIMHGCGEGSCQVKSGLVTPEFLVCWRREKEPLEKCLSITMFQCLDVALGFCALEIVVRLPIPSTLQRSQTLCDFTMHTGLQHVI